MKKFYFLILFLISFALSLSFAQPVVTEEFNYLVGDTLTSIGYSAHSGGTTNAITIRAGSLNYSGYASLGDGNHIQLINTGQDVNKNLVSAISSGNVYAAFLVNIDSAKTGDYFFHLGPTPISTTFRARVFVKKAANGNLSFGLAKGSTNPPTNPSPVYTDSVYSTGTTYLIVVSYEIVDGTNNDLVKLWVNPDLSGSQPSALLSVDDPSNTDIIVGSYAFRQGATASGPFLKLDGLIITQNWNDIVGSASPYILDEDFESITNSGDAIAGWAFNNAQTWNLTGFGHNSDKYAGWDETNNTDHSITSQLVTNPGTLTFWIAAYNDETNLQVKVQYSANGSDWTDAATYTSAGAGGDFGFAYLEKTVPLQLTGDYYIRWTTFNYVSGGFYIDDVLLDNVVPVELTSFVASVSGKSVLLNWNTATELNNSGFDVERKSSSTGWQKIAFVQGNGTTTQPKSYSFTDRNLADGKYSYRLKQVDYDGTYEYSKIVEVNIASAVVNEFELSQNYPNPFNPTTTIKFNLPDAGNVKLSVYNLLGQEVQTIVNGFMESGSHSVNFDASNLNSGVYLYKLEANGFTQTRKMTLIK
jgi:hypothetical protein